MAQLAIKGHPTRGSEVIAWLEMLGGKNIYKLDGGKDLWYILSNSTIEHATYCFQERGYSLYEFEAMFPYKVGDKVITKCGKLGRIRSLIWSDKDNQVRYELDADVDSLHFANELQALEDNDMQADVGTVDINLADHFKPYNEVEIMISDGWKFEQRGNKMFAIRKQYPKTYKECCDVLGLNTMDNDAQGHKAELIIGFQELLIARDAYWKIAGDWKEKRKDKAMHYVICSTLLGEVVKDIMPNCFANYLLDFPTEEMRDAFYENFKELIETCKELL